MSAGYEFTTGRPASCPPDEAKPFSGKIFRGIKAPPISPRDFLSAVEAGSRHCVAEDCQWWGLSVWLTLDAALHARGVLKHMKKWHIAEGTIDASDGVILATPSNAQPQHHTFWKDRRRSVESKFSIKVMPSQERR